MPSIDRSNLEAFVDSVAVVRAERRWRKYRDDVHVLSRVPETYDNPMGQIPPSAREAIDEALSTARDTFKAAELEHVWGKLYKFLLED